MVDFSIIIPIYNVENYLKECLNSILTQSYYNYEIICIEDHSIDNSSKILKQYKNYGNIKIIENQSNIGLGASRNIGLREANGKYIVFVDSDDLIKPNLLEKVWNSFNNNNVDSVWYNVEIEIEGSDNILKNISAYNKQLSVGINKIKNDELFYYCSYAWNKVYKRENIINSNINFAENILFEDIRFYYLYFSKYNDIFFLDEPLYMYRKRTDKTSITDESLIGNNHFEDIFDTIIDTYSYLRKQGINEKIKKSFIQEIIISINMFKDNPNCYKRVIHAAKKAFDSIK